MRYIWFADDIGGYVPLCITDTPVLPEEWKWIPIPCYEKIGGLRLVYWRVRMFFISLKRGQRNE